LDAAAEFFLQIRFAEKNFRLLSGLAHFLRSEQNSAKIRLTQANFCIIELAERNFGLMWHIQIL